MFLLIYSEILGGHKGGHEIKLHVPLITIWIFFIFVQFDESLCCPPLLSVRFSFSVVLTRSKLRAIMYTGVRKCQVYHHERLSKKSNKTVGTRSIVLETITNLSIQSRKGELL